MYASSVLEMFNGFFKPPCLDFRRQNIQSPEARQAEKTEKVLLALGPDFTQPFADRKQPNSFTARDSRFLLNRLSWSPTIHGSAFLELMRTSLSILPYGVHPWNQQRTNCAAIPLMDWIQTVGRKEEIQLYRHENFLWADASVLNGTLWRTWWPFHRFSFGDHGPGSFHSGSTHINLKTPETLCFW